LILKFYLLIYLTSAERASKFLVLKWETYFQLRNTNSDIE